MAKGDNRSLHAANRAKKDEFYTQLSDIEDELRHYKKHFKGKVVYCNCDDPYESSFFQYFVLNFTHLGLKKLICTCYNGSPVAGRKLELPFLMIESDRVAHKLVITDVEKFRNEGGFDLDDVRKALRNGKKEAQIKKLKGDGDFRSEECVKLLEESDIVVTNPPFSLFREYVAQLVAHKKKFLILGNKNAITYTEIFPLIKQNKMWVGVTPMSKEMYFFIPGKYIENAIEANRPRSLAKGKDGQTLGRSPSIWLTNLDHKKRHEELVLYEKYSPEKYPTYDNYDAIEVSKVTEIPKDYDGVMGVPITFLDKYSPEQFEILGLGNGREHFTPTKDYINPIKHAKDGTTAKGREINRVLTLSTKVEPVGEVYYTSDNSDYLVPPYARILIRRK